jgi:hypothetical protein
LSALIERTALDLLHVGTGMPTIGNKWGDARV